jgi:hypothetical protein
MLYKVITLFIKIIIIKIYSQKVIGSKINQVQPIYIGGSSGSNLFLTIIVNEPLLIKKTSNIVISFSDKKDIIRQTHTNGIIIPISSKKITKISLLNTEGKILYEYEY